MDRNEKILIGGLLIILGVACRLLPHFWNFAPITAIALFSGTYLGRRYAIAVPLAAMLIGDFFIGFYQLPLMIAVYGCIAAGGLIGLWLAQHKTATAVFGAAVCSSVLFFLATNWAVWQFSPWYEKSLAGLSECYVLALPFFRASLLSDIIYVTIFFGAYEAIRAWAGYRRRQPAAVKNS